MVVMLQAVGVLAIAPIGRAAARLNKGCVPWLRAERAQGRSGVKGPRPHAHIIGLQDDAAIGRPEIVQRQDHVLKARARDRELERQADSLWVNCAV